MTSTTIPSTMKAAYIEEFKKPMKVDSQRKVPSDLNEYDILVAIKAAGMYNTDESFFVIIANPLNSILFFPTQECVIRIYRCLKECTRKLDRLKA